MTAALRVLGRYARRPDPVELCELCAGALPAEHPHVVDRVAQRLCCACRPCALLFDRANGRHRTVPDRVLFDPGLVLTAADLGAIGVPVQLAFVYFDSARDRWVAQYPSPAGPTDAEIDRAAWEALRGRAPLLRRAADDVEAVLVRGRRGERALQILIAPIDACYALVGIVRRRWRGFDGGEAAWAAIDGFFGELAARARALDGGES